ncbi:hypothetical protein EV207_15915 [Scopulibacillus darangshiensis]|uniref:CAAX prenyl protease 2/Lysostaphin resistance protein A-like domain-containing protein n=1 Tax=Scopulibacillus darangshiensis TaxID=442528 RepID=A0A4R2NES8_9BACL|nr:CPBP family intramembrane glutamic endopeptidase [Scopulibacillus darangshiensis]TCP19730.1 hypothetical protein EV207_15915 [Scopulibacillus darangshiensis]
MPKRYWWILITYVLCQLSGIIPALIPILDSVPRNQRMGVWIISSFAVTLIIVLLLLKPEWKMQTRGKTTIPASVLWAFLGIIMLFVVQSIAGAIEQGLFGEPTKSENTTQIMNLTKVSPYIILVVGIIGPILEEVVFRKVIFGSLYRKLNFFIAGLISSLLFAAAHMDKHILIYTFVGFTLAYLYKHTGRIIVPIAAHASMNTIVVLLTLSPAIQKIIEEQQTAQFIGGLFS